MQKHSTWAQSEMKRIPIVCFDDKIGSLNCRVIMCVLFYGSLILSATFSPTADPPPKKKTKID